MPVIPVVGEMGTGKTTGILDFCNSINQGQRYYLTYPDKEEDIEKYKACGFKCFTQFGKLLPVILKKRNIIVVIDEAEGIIRKKSRKFILIKKQANTILRH